MPFQNSEIAQAFDEIADILEIQGANPFRVRAYRNAARVVSGWPQSLAEVLKKNGELPKISGIGADLSGKIAELIRTRRMQALEELRKTTPEGLCALLRIPGLGPKRVKILETQLGIRSMKDLEAALKAGKVSRVRGFGPKTEQRILKELGQEQGLPKRINIATAEEAAEPLRRYLAEVSGVREVVVAGSFRRRKESVGDLDFLVSADRNLGGIRDAFLKYEDCKETLASGESKSSMILRSGMQVDLRIVPSESYGSALHYFTGSKAHNIAVRAMGMKRGLKINEYGVFRGKRRIGGRTEDEVFKSVGLPFIEPELRENTGEIDAALEGRLPKLVELKDIRGDLHAHSVATDGRASIAAMAEAARRLGYEYLAITDHTRHLSVATGLDPARLRRQIREIDRLNGKLRGFRILKASEVDILEDGRLDLPDDVLRELDLTICSVHFKFDLPRKKQTDRILRAMDSPNFTILGHPTGRLIDRRPPMDVDVEKVMRGARERGRILEVNCQPDRLDLNDTHCRLARDLGVRIAISTDAHSENDLGFMRFGVGQARRGWIGKEDVLNARPLYQLLRLIRKN